METSKLGHRRELDGVRGLAILLVLACHLTPTYAGGGFIGVDLFFVLSGFLITTLLLEEWQARGDISLKAFYTRRALRLLPALVVMLGVMVIYSALREPPDAAAAMRKSALLTFFYVGNWFMAYGTYPRVQLTPTWSLSVEEQFYLVWPLLLLLMLRLRWSRRSMAAFVIVALVSSAAARIWLRATGATVDRAFFGSDAHADGLLAGSLAGLFFSWGVIPRSAASVRALNLGAYLVMALLSVLVAAGWHADLSMVRIGYLAVNLGAMVLVLCLVTSPSIRLRRYFEFGPLVWIGRVSYGIYLWHIAIFWILGGRLPWAAVVAVTFAVAAASFYGLEQPILRFKRRFERVTSAPSSPP